MFRSRRVLPAAAEEKARYETHNNDVNDPGYRRFVSPITAAVMRDFPLGSLGLDFGAGTGPVTSEVLKEAGYEIRQYDPFFHNHPDLLEQRYDYIVCCEVIEHFHYPAREFALLRRLLNPGGVLYCMTHIYHDGIEFCNWYYQRDPTHVFFYRRETLEWIARHYAFAGIETNNRLITLSLDPIR